MRHKLIKTNSFLVILLIMYACIDTIPIDKVEVDDILVVNSVITPDSAFSCNVSHIYSINDTSNHVVTNAQISIYNNSTGELVCMLQHKGNGYYAGNVFPTILTPYRIEVKADGYPTVQGITTIPQKTVVENVTMEKYAGWESVLNDAYSELRFGITDNDTSNNFFEVVCSAFSYSNTDYHYDKTDTAVFQITKIELEDSIYMVEDIFGYANFTIVDPVIKAEGLMQYNPKTLVFTDNLFDGGKHSFNVRCSSYGSGKAWLFCVFTLSEELYKNRVTLMQHLYERGAKGISRFDDMAGLDFSSKAINTYSNLTGGYGIFAGYNSTMLFSKIREDVPVDIIKIDQTENPYE